MVETETSARHDHRRRLLEGMAHAVAENGYSDTTIADIVRAASVSRRTFYEHFATKAECLIALYEAASHKALKVLRNAVDPQQEWQTQLDRGLAAYLGCMAQSPTLVRTLFVEILGLGTDGLAARRRVNQSIAEFVLRVVNGEAADEQDDGDDGDGGDRRGRPLSPAMAMAVVGGINELILEYIERDRAPQLLELVEPSGQLLRAVTRTRP